MPLGSGVGLGPGDIVLDGDPLGDSAPPPPNKGTAAPTFRPMSIVAKGSPISASDLLLFILLFVSILESCEWTFMKFWERFLPLCRK